MRVSAAEFYLAPALKLLPCQGARHDGDGDSDSGRYLVRAAYQAQFQVLNMLYLSS